MRQMSYFFRTGSLTLPKSCLAEVLASILSVHCVFILTATDVNEDADHRYMMFSATFNRSCRELARKFLSDDHVRVRIGRPGSTHVNVDQNVCFSVILIPA
jgi:superfamily II DNA/RNA helicase